MGFFEKLLATIVAIKFPFIESEASLIVLPEPLFKLIATNKFFAQVQAVYLQEQSGIILPCVLMPRYLR
jgi:hypothetical protein